MALNLCVSVKELFFWHIRMDTNKAPTYRVNVILFFLTCVNVFVFFQHIRTDTKSQKAVPSQKTLFTLMHDLLAPLARNNQTPGE